MLARTQTAFFLATAMATPAAASWFYTTDEVGIAAEIVGDGLLPTESFGTNRTVRIWAVMPSGWRLDAVAGNNEQSLHFSTDASFYQDVLGGATSMFIAQALFDLVPEVQWDSFLTIGLEVSSPPMARVSPQTMFTTPGGMPARSQSSAIASAESGVSLAGLQTTVHPAASAGAILRVSMAFGKFHGVMRAATPTGWRMTTTRLSGEGWVITSP